MPQDLTAVHPELRQMFKTFPRFHFTRRNYRLIRWMTHFMPRGKPLPGVQITDVWFPGPEAKQSIRLRVYKPQTMQTPAPVLFWIHGGGYIIGTAKMEDASLARFAQALGLLVVSVEYRLAPQHPFPAPLYDCYAALEWVDAHAEMLEIDPQRIAVGGTSAGGGLAAGLVQLAHDRGHIHPAMQLLVYPMLDDRTVLRADHPHPDLLTWTQPSNRFGWESYLGQPCGQDDVPDYAVPARREDFSGLPPAWIGTGTLDLFYEENVAYAQSLRDAGVPCTLEVVPGAFHGFDGLDLELPLVQAFRESQMAAMRKYLFAP